MNLIHRITIILFSLLLSAHALADDKLQLKAVGSFHTGEFNKSEMEIGAYHPGSKRLFVVAGESPVIRIIDISDPAQPRLLKSIDVSSLGSAANSVAVHGDYIVAAIEAKEKTDPGKAAFYDIEGNLISSVTIGSLPDMICFSPDGHYVLVANEGEPNSGYTVDPHGTISLIDISGGVKQLSQEKVSSIGFEEFSAANLPQFVRIATPGEPVTKDFEPEYIAIAPNSTKAWVSLQENNAIAEIDISTAKVSRLLGLPFVDHSKEGRAIDASNKDGGINIKNWPVKGMPMPDAIAVYQVNGTNYIVTANEGDSRDYQAWSEEARVADLKLDEKAFPNVRELQKKSNLGRLKVTTTMGDSNGDGKYEELYSFGSRSFSIFKESGERVYDSGDFFECYLAKEMPDYFNSNGDDNNSFDNRSDDKGPEPEGLALGTLNGKTYAFIGMERIGGVFAFDVSDPASPVFQCYVNSRNFEADAKSPEAGDLGPEGLLFISPEESPNDQGMLVVFSEVSGSMTIYQILQ